GGRFVPVRRLGEGGFGVVWEVLDRERDQHVALKRFKRRDPARLRRLKREFRALADLRHPRLLRLHDLWLSHSDAFFTMDLVHGVDIVTFVAGGATRGRATLSATEAASTDESAASDEPDRASVECRAAAPDTDGP